MKELSIEEKAKAYDKALERAKAYHNDYTKDIMEEIFPELKESEDEKIRKGIIYGLNYLERELSWDFLDNVDILDAYAWLEKQGEQKHVEWHREDEQNLNACLGYIPDEFLRKWLTDVIHTKYDKPTDNVESKFKVGDWVVYDHRVYQVVELPKEGYINLCLKRNEKIEFAPSPYCEHWTIQDAKDGDVLSDGTTIFIFKDLLSDGSVMSYCDYDTDSGESDAFCPLSVNLMCSKITPTTKEQCDLLFQKMHEARYMWDSEKKELKKIEQPTAWGEENERLYRRLHNLIYSTPYCDSRKELSDWLESLKHRNRWRPSDEQMNILFKYAEQNNKDGSILTSLYQDLKRLKE